MKGKKPAFPVMAKNLTPGKIIDIRALEQIAFREHCEIVLYFEEDLAKNSSYEQDLRDYGNLEEHERPFIILQSFLKFQREMNPIFDEALSQIPLGVTILRIESTEGNARIIGLLPFLDEMDTI